MNEIENIIFKSDLNGNITPGNSTWHIYMNYMMLSQNNKDNTAYIAEIMTNSKMSTNYFEKSATGDVYGGGITSFHPVIEYSE